MNEGTPLTALVAAFEADRAAIDAAHPPLGHHLRVGVRDQCRYCGGTWQLWNGARFEGHVRCAVSEQFQRELVCVIDADPRLTFTAVGLALGVSTSVIRAWWVNVKTPRRRPFNPRPRPQPIAETKPA